MHIPARLTAASLIGLSLLATTACGRHRGGGWEPTTQTRAEYTAGLDQRFQRLDRNNDGAIQADELRGRMAGRMARMDTDHDGEISRAEFTSGSLAQFDAADTNHDGTATVEEWRALRERHRGGGDAAVGNTAAPTTALGNTTG